MKLFVVAVQGLLDGPGMMRSLINEVERAMSSTGSVNSQSGRTAALAINWCERHGKDYDVRCSYGMYFVEVKKGV